MSNPHGEDYEYETEEDFFKGPFFPLGQNTQEERKKEYDEKINSLWSNNPPKPSKYSLNKRFFFKNFCIDLEKINLGKDTNFDEDDEIYLSVDGQVKTWNSPTVTVQELKEFADFIYESIKTKTPQKKSATAEIFKQLYKEKTK